MYVKNNISNNTLNNEIELQREYQNIRSQF